MKEESLTTKQHILDTALTLFSVRGYDQVTVVEIAEGVGIKAPSLYNHYKSKQDIFEAIISVMENRYQEQAVSLQINGNEAEKDKDFFMRISDDHLVEIGKKQFLFFIHDEYMSKFRKMLTIEHYSNETLSAMYTQWYVDDSLSYMSELFATMAESGILIQANPQIMAIQFYSPIFLMLNLCDSHPERESEAMQLLEHHIRQFSKLYRNTEAVNK